MPVTSDVARASGPARRGVGGVLHPWQLEVRLKESRSGWKRTVRTEHGVHEVTVSRDHGARCEVQVGDTPLSLDVREGSVLVDGRAWAVHYELDDRGVLAAVWLNGQRVETSVERGAAKLGAGREAEGGMVRSPMNGQVLKVLVEAGTRVDAGTCILVLEAMKMENEVRSPVAGHVTRLEVQVGQTVAHHAPLFVVTPNQE